jgi:DNA-3-methyladenine glycosylase II
MTEDPWSSPDDQVVWEEALPQLRAHPHIGRVVDRVGPVRLPPPDPLPFRALARAIVFQQLAGRAAASIWGRVEAVLHGQVTPEGIGAATDGDLRGAGLSRGKLAALRDLAARSPELELAGLSDCPDAEVMDRLTSVRGIGPWTARMHLIFELRRPDIWPVLDLGVRGGWARIHGLSEPPSPRALDTLADDLRPWRSAVAWYCWRVIDTRMELDASPNPESP